MKELEVRFLIADKENYLKVIEFLDQNYKFKSENRQIDKYYKERGKETEEDISGSFIYRFRQENDSTSGIFTRKDTVKPGFWKEDEIVLESQQMDFVKKILDAGFSNIMTIDKCRRSYTNLEKNKTINADILGGLGYYIEVEIIGDFSEDEYDSFVKETEIEFEFINSKIETKGYVQLMREKNERTRDN
ncbi:TPA: adenylate cyclase [Streptococcus suis]|nr:adenylate cyclase [Streptococcus suis]HEM3560239.1 adenylate cyclase [Streptococcus suis]